MPYSGRSCIPPHSDQLEPFTLALQDHPSLRILSLSGCKLGNDVAAPLFQALERNQHLEELWLQNTRNNHHLTCKGSWIESLPKLQRLGTLGLPHGISGNDVDFTWLLEALRRNLSLTSCYFYIPPTDPTFSCCTNGTLLNVEQIMRRNKLYQHVQSCVVDDGNNNGDEISITWWPIWLETLGRGVEAATVVFAFFKLGTSQATLSKYMD